jgi:hypothetical protein
MTSKLQPMDLVVNSVCKAAMRRRRIELILKYFAGFKHDYTRAQCFGETLPKYNPPSPKLIHGIEQMLLLRDMIVIKTLQLSTLNIVTRRGFFDEFDICRY